MDDHHSITPRFFDYTEQDTPKYWLDNCPIKTYFANALSFFIPEGEKFFIKSVKPYLGSITNPLLKQDVKNFIRQEANHCKAYSKYIHQVIFQHYPKLLFQDSSFFITKLFIFLGGKKMRLAVSAVGEHFTAVLSDLQLSDPDAFKGVSSNIKKLWQWHCIEEIEHKAVVYEVFLHVKGSYFLRLYSFIIMTCFIFFLFAKIYWHMMKHDGNHKHWVFYKKSFHFLLKNPGYFRKIIKIYFSFLHPRFHPWQHDNRALLKTATKYLRQD